MTENIFVKGLQKELVERLERFCEENKITKKEAVEQALQLLLESRQESRQSQRSTLKLILLKYPSRCTVCGADLRVGDLAYYDFEDRRAICVPCFSRSHAEIRDVRKIYELYKSIRRLKAMKTLAEQELNELISRIDELERLDFITKTCGRMEEIINVLESYLMTVEANVDLAKIRDELRSIQEKIDEFLATHRLNIKKLIRVKG